MNSLTIFTPVYNRKVLLIRLLESLCDQTSNSFTWLIIDDGSTDGTESAFNEAVAEKNPEFRIRYIYKENGGKQRAINDAVSIIDTEYIFIVDSDDILVPDAIEKVLEWINEPVIDKRFAGVSGVKGNFDGRALSGVPNFDGDYIDCTNLERKEYNLHADMAEVYRTDILKKYPFEVWPEEKFVPEALVWDKIAEHGYLIRWHKDIIYLCDYLEEGLTKGSWKLLRDNPMGYAMLFEHNCAYSKNKIGKVKNIIMMDSCLILASNLNYLTRSNYKYIGLALLPLGFLLSLRRKKQFKKYIIE